ncbi:MAG: Gfo/Idh/MocA family oxidoreductase [Sphaerochaetaceae bacterium]|jgi:predicted dehydrogenase|nr:Gfo/Idh/MocA family oxidoreductase [Sphaerochaetaceae bacterium]NLO61553.1 Gfo/Idh/MocA family oxidoreductase [Spirochaetales bacterium]MDD2407003.1 Gfo/Idh/MocA family oxidoreductase [Sphaerochaetaceae bacterium]MDD3670787.1 Gfo/Idh/MocA family oxidoreductase [Sphaerochaetaceae bacterium]MDD4260164.1 Gfo/Idh/MocA family oxidoreductase [Sphaerochaetaceae bacterium]
MVKLGIIGTGIIAHEHIKAAQQIPGVHIVALSNRTLGKAIDVARTYGIDERNVFGDYHAMLASVKLDGAIICLANHLHEESAIACANVDVPVLLEKPMAQDSEACKRINALFEATKTKLMIGHTQRYNPLYVATKRIIDSKELGKLIMVKDSIHYHYFWEGRPAWFLDDSKCGGGILMNYGVHTLDRVCYLTGQPINTIFAHVDWEQPAVAVDSGYQIMALMGNDISMTMTCTGYSNPFVNATEFIFSKGIVRVTLRDNVIEPKGVWIGSNEHDFKQIPVEDDNSYRLQLVDFLKYLNDETPSPIDGAYGQRIVELVERSYQSHKEQRSVEV